MSSKAMGWAMEQEGLSPTIKIVLLAMADVASDTGKAFSSNRTICRVTGHVKEETISEAQKTLCDYGIIADTKKRTGGTGRVKVFQFHPDACKEQPDDDCLALFNRPGEMDYPPELDEEVIPRQSPAERGIKSPANPPLIPRQSPVSRDTPNKGELGTGNREGVCACAPGQNQEQKQPGDSKPSPFREFSDAWCSAYKSKFGQPYPYNGRDVKAVSPLIKAGTFSPAQLVAIAQRAWEQTDRSRWNCVNMSRAVHKFISALPDINAELATPAPADKFNRNVGTHNENLGPDYVRDMLAASGRRADERSKRLNLPPMPDKPLPAKVGVTP